MTAARIALAVLCCLLITGCGGGDEPVPDDVCLVDGKPVPKEQCR